MSTRQIIKQIKQHYSHNKSNNSIQIFSEDFVFDKTCYDPNRISQWLSKKEFNIIISELNKVVTKSFIKKNKSERITVYNFLYFLLAVIALFFCLGSFCLFQAHQSYDAQSKDINLSYVIGIVLFSFMLILLFGLSWYNFKHITYQRVTLENTIHNYIKQYIGFLNVYFQGVLKWVYHQSIVMIEIIILNNDDDDNCSPSSFNHDLLHRERDYIDELLNVFEEEDDEIGKEIDSRLYGRKIKEKPHPNFSGQSNSEMLLKQASSSFQLSKENLRKVIEKNKRKRVKIFNCHNERLTDNIKRAYSK